MKRTIKLLLLCTAFTGCTEHSATLQQPLDLSCYSRGVEGIPKKVEDFAMYVEGEGAEPYPSVTNPVHVTYESGWKYPEIIIGTQARIYAFHPYSASSDITAIPLELESQTDYLSTPNPFTADHSSPSVQIEMSHLLSRIHVTIDGSEEVEITPLNVPTSGSYHLREDRITRNTPKERAFTHTTPVLIFPSNSPITLELSYQGKTYQYVTQSSNHEPGKEYTYHLKIDERSHLVIDGDVLIKGWVAGGDYNGSIQL